MLVVGSLESVERAGCLQSPAIEAELELEYDRGDFR